jgi:hypothetical protein
MAVSSSYVRAPTQQTTLEAKSAIAGRVFALTLNRGYLAKIDTLLNRKPVAGMIMNPKPVSRGASPIFRLPSAPEDLNFCFGFGNEDYCAGDPTRS